MREANHSREEPHSELEFSPVWKGVVRWVSLLNFKNRRTFFAE